MCSRYDFHVSDNDLQAIEADFAGVFRIPENFKRSAPTHDTTTDLKRQRASPPQIYVNPQTTLLCDMLELTDPFASFTGTQSQSLSAMGMDDSVDNKDVCSDDDDDDFIDTTMESSINTTADTCNPDEISLDDLDDDDGDGKQDEDDGGKQDEDGEKKNDTGASKIEPTVLSVAEDAEVLSQESANMSVDQKSDSAEGCESSSLNTSSDFVSSPKKRRSGPMLNADSIDMMTSTPNTASAKKFKRRNQSIYSTPGGDD